MFHLRFTIRFLIIIKDIWFRVMADWLGFRTMVDCF